MDLIDKGKKLAQEGKYGDALDSFVLALENDKENPDIHFYIGLCYSSLEEFGYAKYHYQMALSLNPLHEKTKMVWDGIKDVIPQKPSEKKIVRSASHKALKEEDENLAKYAKTPVEDSLQAAAYEETASQSYSDDKPKKFKMTGDVWEKAFPIDNLPKPIETAGFPFWIFGVFAGIAVIASLVYFLLSSFSKSIGF